MAKIKIEGQTLTMDDEIAKDDELLKAALVTSWPDAKTASFKREGGKDGKELVVTVQKKAGTKGALIERLFDAPEGVNPAVVMSARIAEMARAGELNPELVRELLPEIGSAAELGERDLDAANAALGSLMGAGAIASKEVPLGF
jgi:hypothetical protein